MHPIFKERSKNMNRNQRKAALVAQGILMADIAKHFKVRPTTVSQVIAGRSKSSRIQRYVAKKLGMTVDELWPEPSYAA